MSTSHSDAAPSQLRQRGASLSSKELFTYKEYETVNVKREHEPSMANHFNSMTAICLVMIFHNLMRLEIEVEELHYIAYGY